MKNTEKHIAEYFSHVAAIHASGAGVAETSYYPPLQKLLNDLGATLKPKVRCIIHLKNQGAGIPDGGLFTADQISRNNDDETDFTTTLPARGVLEVKSPGESAEKTADGDQVDKYFRRYRQVLVTNLWDFILVGQDAAGGKTRLERFRLVESEADFWASARNPKTLVAAKGRAFAEYLTRVFLHAAPLADPQEVARFLASYAKEAKYRLEEKPLPALESLRTALEEALGISFATTKAEQFFRSTLIQTLFYGIFSAWVMWSKEHPPTDRASRFDWRVAAWTLHVPMIGALFELVISPTKLRPLDLEEVLDWTTTVLNRVDRAEFFNRFADGEAVQYFYEPFLAAFDPDLRKEMGVWYTPPEIVRYMVERVDRALRSELGVADGFADESVYVLDPCCGTGAYLVETLRRIAKTWEEKGGDALTHTDIKRAAMRRIFGFELLPAPYVVAHLQIGLLLQDMGTPLKMDDNGANERVAVYLTNSLTGWEPQKETPKNLLPELDAERDAAEKIKQQVPILVILGNPPYNAFAGVAPKEEQGLVNVYKEGLQSDWGIKKFNLDDLYVRFFRLAERRIAEKTGRGIVCFISSSSYMDDASYVVMRKRLMDGFDSIHIDNLNGDSRETGKLTPDGKPDPSVFSTEHNKEGIRVGTAVSLLVRKGEHENTNTQYREFWGTSKRCDLLETLNDPQNNTYRPTMPEPSNRFSFKPLHVSARYKEWPKLTDLCSVPPQNGLMEKRGGVLIDMDQSVLVERMKVYLDKNIPWATFKTLIPRLSVDAARFKAEETRSKVQSNEQFNQSQIQRYHVRPFDIRWAYYCGVRPLWNEPRPSLYKQLYPGNKFLISRVATTKKPEGMPISFSSKLIDDHYLSPDASAFAFFQGNPKGSHQISLTETNAGKPNLSAFSQKYLQRIFTNPVENLTESQQTAIWFHALAIGYSPTYLMENADGIRIDWPRIPLPQDKDSLEASAALGHRIASLLDVDMPVHGVTQGKINPILRHVGSITAVAADKTLDPDKGHLKLTTGWGHAGKDGVTMPGMGKLVERDYSPEEMETITQGAQALGLTQDEALDRLGATTYDIYLNNAAFWRNVPKNVWEYYIGGYQVIKKWLSYRESDLLGRSLTTAEVRYVTDVARRLTALRLMEKELDKNYYVVAGGFNP
ncbi:MAG: N-6 DNA methylase [Desulfovibrio sp.]|jgi:hypothetical protein|nr:N-6 DNA methylase [Desulfovibrio sp.]